MEQCKVDKNAILHMWRQILEQTGIDKYTSEQWQVQYEDFCRCMLSASEPFVAIASIEGLARNCGIPLDTPLLQDILGEEASATGIAKTSKSAGANAKKSEANKELMDQQRAQQHQIYQKVYQQQQEQLKSYDKENVPILLQKCVNATRKLQPQRNPEQEATQYNVKMQGMQNYRIPRKIQDYSKKPLASSFIGALNGSKYSQKLENYANSSGKKQEEKNMQGAVWGSTLPDVQPENDMQEKDDKSGEKESWFKKNFEVFSSRGTPNSKESRKKKNKSKRRDD